MYLSEKERKFASHIQLANKFSIIWMLCAFKIFKYSVVHMCARFININDAGCGFVCELCVALYVYLCIVISIFICVVHI